MQYDLKWKKKEKKKKQKKIDHTLPALKAVIAT
jgi:hypothetical protein